MYFTDIRLVNGLYFESSGKTLSTIFDFEKLRNGTVLNSPSTMISP